ncbi:heat shock 70 kDa protein 12A-like isoform X2 [Dreissena polymorpha]|uniref:Uncharacterized protein n=1 Tax=Dreissena polymorpha TaxID=45954 RepID=A0A9D4EIN8_DREPO|nr:heat shock 70 kDa protein 12A-like isoform X2 [Dreissena polymorpha]KAH3778785.1 hypothetical protein DPMN_180256 [Dreissena polymorpha]
MGGEESKLKEKKKAETCKVIASIDFGTRYTGYAFMFRSKASNVEIYKPQRTDMKREHTCIMLIKKSTGKFEFVSFGTKAMDKFIEMEKEGNDDFFFFRLFKTDIMLAKEKEKSLFVKDYQGREVDAQVVFSYVYGFVQSKTLDFLKKSVKEGERLQDDDILWVITIPATWGLMYRDFIRKAAEKSYHNIEIVLEPEAASMYIRNKPMVCSFNGKKIEPFKNGQCYILVDIGAGTTDICTHKVLPDGNLIEICSSSGINEGGEQVNKTFFNELKTLFTEEVMDKFKHENMRFYKLEKEFEDIKHKFKTDTDNAFVLILDEKLLNIFHETTGRKFEIPSTFSEKLELKNSDHMHMKPKFMASLFDHIISTISSKICEQICETENAGHTISCIILSGGLSESDYVYESISKTLTDSSGVKVPIILSPNARNAVVEGALQMGHNPKGIAGRRSPYTYGFY